MRTLSSRFAMWGARRWVLGLFPVLVPTLGALALMGGFGAERAEAKTPGKTYCFYRKCHRVKTLAEIQALLGKDETLQASHYDSCKRDRYNPCGLTSSGAVFDSESPDNAASPIYPDGTKLLVWSPDTGASLVLRVNNAGPYWGDRKLDVSRRAAEVLGFAKRGVATLKVRVIHAPSREEATYKKYRTYDPVPGYIGQFASLDAAQTGAATAYMVAGLASPFPAETVLGAGNPTQVAGLAGAQSGAAPAVPSVLAAVAPKAAAPQPAAEPVKVAALAETPAAPVVRDVAPSVRSRPVAERTSARNSRSQRVAARHKQRKAPVAVRSTATAVAAASQPEQPAKRYVTQDGTNDMSVFSRHTYAGIKRLAPQETRRRAYSSLGGNGREG